MDASLISLIGNGLALGAAYALAAIGFVIVINAVGAVNFATGDFVMAGGFLGVFLASFLPGTMPIPGILLLPAILVLAAAMGWMFSLLAYFPLKNRPPTSVFISTIAVGMILQHGSHAIFGPEPRAGPPLISGGQINQFGLTLSIQQAAVIIVAGAVMFGVYLILFKTQLGRHMRAAAQDREAAEAMGVAVDRVIMVSFALAIALACSAGLMVSNQFFVAPTDGGDFMLKAYIATTIGGWGRIKGAAVGALIIGLFETIVAGTYSYVVAEAALYLALLAVLLWRPSGLFGEAMGRRV